MSREVGALAMNYGSIPPSHWDQRRDHTQDQKMMMMMMMMKNYPRAA
jgi:hypothetical protein